MNKEGKMRIIELSVGTGKHHVHGIGTITGEGIIVSVLGGDRPHVGAIALAIPRTSLKDPKRLSATTSILTLIGHKDDEIAKPLSEKIAKELNQAIVVIAGVHIEKASEEDIKKLVTNSMQVADKLIAKFREMRRSSNLLT